MDEANVQKQDIEYQPQQQGYVFAANGNTPSKNPKKKLKKILLSIFIILILILFFVISIIVLIYFQIIPHPSNISIFNFLSQKPNENSINLKNVQEIDGFAPYKISDQNEYRVDGKLEKYTNKTVTIVLENNTKMLLNYDYNSNFLIYINNPIGTESAEAEFVAFTKDVLNKSNIGKLVSIEYKVQKNANYLETLSLTK